MVDTDITSDDIHKIKSIGWLVFDPAQRLDLLIESNTLIRAFLGETSWEGVSFSWSSVATLVID